MNQISLTIDGKRIQCEEGLTILEAARSQGIDIPTICYHESLTPPGLCRQCVVEVKGARVLLPSCITEVKDGMVVETSSPRVMRARRTILEMLSASADLSEAPDLKKQIDTLQAQTERFKPKVPNIQEPLIDNPFYIRDYGKCILCGKCVQVCSEEVQLSYALTVAGRGFDSRIATFYNRPLPETSCVFCGNCIEVCPTGALKPRKEFENEI
ncbi:2Fe-2S iron-sulfur cluster-binding protein [Spirochaeta isovalerica]|uniref:NADH dehydrogenase/NADH:ubiquinone oxidoreductase subunit G n=1 Tax=Spirochaeta isovalerica TaxID=150 RepID=A0A841R885_9SPIO|nr:2Fe-2S iron-sulfur cluster-binding protein [Spirochaeta isovalerica]MBB6478948.1 NADH dehydrogenase/NADH:ubiquinone oxidoreductase subunit G [Spirochaeta isovalerica]